MEQREMTLNELYEEHYRMICTMEQVQNRLNIIRINIEKQKSNGSMPKEND